MQNLIIVDRASAKSYIIEIGNQGYEVFVGEKISSEISSNTSHLEPVKESEELISETPKEIKKKHIRKRKRLQRKLLREITIKQIKDYAFQHDGEPPFAKDMAVKYGRISYNTIVRIFGSFNKAVEEAGFTPRKTTSKGKHSKSKRVNAGAVNSAPEETQSVTTQPEKDGRGRGRVGRPLEYHQHQLILEILTIAGKVHHTPTKKEFDAHTTTISSRAVRDYFGTYNNGIVAAGLKPNRKHAGYPANNLVTPEELSRLTAIECIKYITNRLGHVPNEAEVDESREISMQTLLKSFVCLEDAIHAASLINPTKRRGVYVPDCT